MPRFRASPSDPFVVEWESNVTSSDGVVSQVRTPVIQTDASGNVIQEVDTLSIGGVAVTATAAEINQLDGLATSLSGLTATPAEINRACDLSANGAVRYLQVVPIPTSVRGSGAEQATTLTLPPKCIIHDVWLDITAAEATGTTKTVDLGTAVGAGGDPDGFLDGVSVAATGLVKGTLASGGQTLGALLRVDESGGGVLVPEGSIVCGGRVLVITAGSADFAELAGNIIVDLTRIL